MTPDQTRRVLAALIDGTVKPETRADDPVATAALLDLVRSLTKPIDRLRRTNPGVVTMKRSAEHVPGVFNKCALQSGCDQAGLTLTDVLLAARAVADLPEPLPGEPDLRPVGNRLLALFTPSGDDVCIDQDILDALAELEGALPTLRKQAAEEN